MISVNHIKIDRLERHWRRVNEKKELESYAKTMTLGATVNRSSGSRHLSFIDRPIRPEINQNTYDDSAEIETIGFLATFSSRPPAIELQLKAEDVSVLYFDPSPDGTTKVKRLRISDDGEFIDRWPRGFFTEREQDLFDE